MEQEIFRELIQSLNKSQEYKICLLLQKQKELLESDISTEEMARTFIVYDNEFHYALYELAGKKNICLFYNAINSQYERFRTFINLGSKEDLFRLYNEHEQLWNDIITQNTEQLKEHISHHLYEGFNSSMKVIRDHPEYFTTTE